MGARENIMGRIRKTAGIGNGDDPRRRIVEARLAEAPAGIVPGRGQLEPGARAALFEEMARRVSASVSRVRSYREVAREVARYLREKNLPASVRVGADPRLSGVGWEGEKTLEVLHGPSDGGDLAGVSHALAGIAETGTVALASGADNPTTINFLPEHHIVVLRTSEITGDLESAWRTLRHRFGKGSMPRALNLVTGPSRSGDIEQTILLGAHGPRALHLIVVEE